MELMLIYVLEKYLVNKGIKLLTFRIHKLEYIYYDN